VRENGRDRSSRLFAPHVKTASAASIKPSVEPRTRGAKRAKPRRPAQRLCTRSRSAPRLPCSSSQLSHIRSSLTWSCCICWVSSSPLFGLGRGPGVLLSFMSVAAFDFFFVPPRTLVLRIRHAVSVDLPRDAADVAHDQSSDIEPAPRGERIASPRARTGAMYAMTRELGAALMTQQIIEIGSRHVGEVFQARSRFCFPTAPIR
jgi:hypothetical protein